MNSLTRKRERGIAMLIVLFSLLLLSVIGLGMMYSTNMETSINSNYRDKQSALYAALAGLQEARDRIQPATHNIVAPTALPSTTAPNVIYIVSDYATVNPWDMDDKYFDTELCQQKVLGIPAGTPGIPCTATASGMSWFQYVDNSDVSSAPWNLANPLDWKWTRIELKGNNMTPVPVNGDSNNSAQACWNGTNQMSTPTGYSTGCKPVGGVTAVTVITSGTGYTSTPTVTLSGGGGSGAVATAVTNTVIVTNGVVTSLSLTTGGSAYTSTPSVDFSGGGGSGATATAHIASLTEVSGYVDAISLTTSGSAYTSAPTIVFSGGGGSGATAVATVSVSAPVTSINLNSAGSKCYAPGAPPTISFTGGGGSGAAATAVLETTRSCIYSWSVPTSPNCSNQLNSNNGYNPVDQKSGVTFPAGNHSFSGTLRVQAANDKTPLSSGCCSVEDPGYDTAAYTTSLTSSNLQLGASSWTDCGNITTNSITVGYRLASISLTSGGSGYTSAPAISFGTGAGTAVGGPTATAAIGPIGVTAITLTNGGSGYTSAPTMTFSGGGGSGAAATSHIQTMSTTTYFVDSITLGMGGTGYTSAPTVTISGGGGSGALATAAITTTSNTVYFVDHIDVTPPGGSGYTTNPTVTIGGPGTGATATATISGGTKFGQVYLLTSFAQTRTGARSMLQMEVASPVLGYAPGGALTLDGPNPVIDAMPNSMNFVINGTDANSCPGQTPEPTHPAIDGYDDPNANPPTASVQTITGSLPRPDHYIGAGGTPSVQNGYASLGETMTTPIGLKALIEAIRVAPGAHDYGNNPGSIALGTATSTIIDYVDGDLTLSGNNTGYGILVVTGTLTFSGNFGWKGLVFVVGDGKAEFTGGGNGQIVGSMLIAKIWDGYATKNLLNSLGSPTMKWNGGGGNGISYDSCWATNLMNNVPFTPPPSTKPLKVLSFRILPY